MHVEGTDAFASGIEDLADASGSFIYWALGKQLAKGGVDQCAFVIEAFFQFVPSNGVVVGSRWDVLQYCLSRPGEHRLQVLQLVYRKQRRIGMNSSDEQIPKRSSYAPLKVGTFKRGIWMWCA